ncbi:MAG: proline dehydrogenase family protein [Candidatus Nanohaloarchaeota archaeon QJJ-5]|nr:proline dehydrogenase family protein [Candidatus Nanohaloarchaeota archaeon QJJ-5]
MIPPIARRFIAGTTADSALDHVRAQNDAGITCLMNKLGEHYHDQQPAREDTQAYQELIKTLAQEDVGASVSVKPSQIGLFIDEETFSTNFANIVETAAAHDIRVWLDMEDHTTTDATIQAYRDNVSTYEEIGICLQANLKRTSSDIQTLAETNGWIRLVKGAYSEPDDIAFSSTEKIDTQYKELLDMLFESYDGRIAAGTHDPAMIEYVHELHETYDRSFQHQMLMGVRMDRQRELAQDYDVAQYVPYGPEWMAYFYRRLREKKENLLFGLRAVLTG